MKSSSSQPGRFGPLGAFGIAWRCFWLLRLGTWIQLLVPVCIQDLAPHINSTETEKSCCTEPSRVLQGGGLPSFLWLPLVQLLLDFFWLISWPHFFFFFAFCHAKVETSYLFAFVFLSCHFSVVSHKRGGKCLDSAAILNLKPHHPYLV